MFYQNTPHSYIHSSTLFFISIYIFYLYIYMPSFVQLNIRSYCFKAIEKKWKQKTNLIRLFILLIRFFTPLSILHFKVLTLRKKKNLSLFPKKERHSIASCVRVCEFFFSKLQNKLLKFFSTFCVFRFYMLCYIF